ncbi:MAG: DUF6364 family protein [Spirosomaceae bacterium]|jgi:hypothetical protein|nr:DUF6364 family protein [Spirosomataceae bacterium]
MKTKLTLSVDLEAVQMAKYYATLHNTTVSALFEQLMQTLPHKKSKEEILIADKYYGILSSTKYAKMTDEELKTDRHKDKYGY